MCQRFSTGSLSSVQSTHRLVQAALRMVTCFGRPMVWVSPDGDHHLAPLFQKVAAEFAGLCRRTPCQIYMDIQDMYRRSSQARQCSKSLQLLCVLFFARSWGNWLWLPKLQRFCAKNDKLCGPIDTAMIEPNLAGAIS